MGLVLLALLCQESIPDLVRKLGDDSIEARERATRRLRAIGEEALPALQASPARELDFQTRSAVLIKQIERERWFDPRLLQFYPDFAAALLDDNHQAGSDHARRIREISRDREDFGAYALHLLDQPETEPRKAGTWLLPPQRWSPRVIRCIEEWDPDASADKDRLWLRELVRIALERVTPEDRSMLERISFRHEESRQALAVLQAAVGIPEATPTVIELLQKGPPWLRLPAIQAVRKSRCRDAREALVGLLASSYFGPDAARTLTELADESWGPRILEALGSLKPQQRPAGHAALLARWGGPEATPLLREALDTSDRGPAADALSERATDFVDELLPHLDKTVGRAIGRRATAAQATKLVSALTFESIRDGVVIALASLRDPVARREFVRRCSTEQDQRLRGFLFQAAMQADFEESDAALELVVRNLSDPLAPSAAYVLIERQGKKAIRTIEDAILASEAPVPWNFWSMLAPHPSEHLVPYLRRKLPGADFSLAYYASDYLAALGSTDDVRTLCTHSDPRARRHAAEALARATGEAHPALFIGQDPYPSDLVARDIPGLREELRRRVRSDGLAPHLRSLQAWAHPDMIDGLRKMLLRWDGDFEPRKQRSQMMICGTGRPYEPDGGEILGALAATGDRSLSPLFVDRLTAPDLCCQLAAIRICSEWKIPEAGPILRRLARTGGPETRKAAAAALEKK